VRDVGADTAEAPALAIDRAVNGLGANGVAVSNGVLLTDGDGMEPRLVLPCTYTMYSVCTVYLLCTYCVLTA
jgi:hypothetical protein